MCHGRFLKPNARLPVFLPEPCASCQGRSFEDIMPWKDLLDEGSGKFYTNEDLYDLFDPTNEKLTYVYEHFDWDHCSSFIENYSADNNRVW